MRGDVPAAAVRLSCALPVREHRADEPIDETLGRPTGKRRAFTGTGKGSNQGTPCTINGETYPNMKALKRALHIGQHKAYRLLDEGAIQKVER